MHVTLDFDDAADMARKFDALSAGGKIDDAAAGHVLGREVRHADRRPRRLVDVQLPDDEVLTAPGTDIARWLERPHPHDRLGG